MTKKPPRPKLSESKNLIDALVAKDRQKVIDLVTTTPLARVGFVGIYAFDTRLEITPPYIADLLIARSEIRGPVVAVDEIELALIDKRVPAMQVMAVCGLWPSAPLRMGDVQIIPIVTLDPISRGSFSLPPQASAAILRPALTPITTNANSTSQDDEWWRWYEELTEATDDVLNRIAIASRGSCHCINTWHIRDPRDPWFERAGLSSHSFLQNGGSLQGTLTEETMALASSYRDDQIEGNRLALNRYRRACTSGGFEDRAVEIAIAFEALLLRKEESQGEISLRLRLRAAHLLGDSFETRRRIYDLIKEVYNTRSGIVHSGGVSTRAMTLYEQNAEAIRLFPFAAEKLLRRDTMKSEDWDRLLLGGSIDPEPPSEPTPPI